MDIRRNYQIPFRDKAFIRALTRVRDYDSSLYFLGLIGKQQPVSSAKYDIVIIGAGIIGLATGMKLLERFPNINLAILEKDGKEGTQQSGHNSGVIHSGIYYKPGSLKAKFCVAGRTSMTQFCNENGIPVRTCGK